MRKKIIGITGVCLFFLILSLIDTYPLVNYINKGMPYFPYPERGHEISYMVHGDYLQLYYNLWLFKDAISGNIPFFTNPYEFSAGAGYMPSFNTQFFPLSFFFSILSPFGDITAYNLLVILSYVLTGLSCYFLVKLYTESWMPALFAGTVLALFPYRTGQLLGGHPNGFLFFLIPLMIYFLEKSFKKGSLFASLGAGACVISISLLEGHFHFYSFLLLSLFLPWRFFFGFDGETEGVPAKESEIQLRKDIKIKDATVVFSAGTVAGLSLILIRSKPPILGDPIFYSSLVLPFLLLGFWILYSRLFSFASGTPFMKSLRDDAVTYLPFLFFFLYLARFIYPIEHLGKGIAIVSLCGIIVLKGYRLYNVRQGIRERLRKASPLLKKRLFKTILPFLLMCSLTVVWAMYTRSHLETSIAAEGRPITQIMKYSPEIGDILERHNRSVEKNIYLGLLPLVLACMSLFLRKVEGRRNILFFGAIFIVSLTLSFGPNLEPYIHLYNILYDHLPFFNYPRVAGRMITVSAVAMAVLSGYGLKWLTTSSPSPQSSPQRERKYKDNPSPLRAMARRGEGWVRGRHFYVGLIFIFTLLDFSPFSLRGISIPSKGNAVYEEISKNRGDKKVIEIPIWPGDSAWSSIYQYYVTLYRYHMINGYDPGVSKRYVEEIFNKLYPLDFGELREGEYNLLKDLRVKYIVMHEEEFPRKVSPFPFRSSLDNMKRSPYVKFINKDGLIYLFEVNDDVIQVKNPEFSISSPIGGLYQAETLPRLVGTVVKDVEASGGEAAFGKMGIGEGWLQYGPYRTYPTGEYKAVFRLKIGEKISEGSVAIIDISTQMSKGVLNRKVISTADFVGKGYKDFTLPFKLSSPQGVEFRVYYTGIADLWVDYTYILPSGEKDPRWSYKSEDLFHLPDRIEGPTRRYPIGDYIATFYIKTENIILKNITVIEVLTEGGVIEKAILSKVSTEVNKYSPVSLRYRLERESFIDFKVSSKDMTKIGLKGIEIKRVKKPQENN